ncbi:MAG: inositol 2-dehydrogenase [Candidatus Bipolaricaulia bacterium]
MNSQRQQLNVGVIGLGRIGGIHAESLANRIPRARLAAVADLRTDLAERVAAQYGVERWYNDYRPLLDDRRIEAVLITTPTSTHKEMIVAAAQAGKQIFCEKPIALTLEETDAALDAVKRAGVKFQVGFMMRFDAGNIRAKEQIEAGVIGTPLTFKTITRDAGCPDPQFANPKHSGGIIIDMGIHDFDRGRWLMNSEVERVYAEGGLLVCQDLEPVGDIDNASVNLRFANGALGNVEVSRTAFYGYDLRAEVLGSKGALLIGEVKKTPVWMLTEAGVTHDTLRMFEGSGTLRDAYTEEIKHFVDCVLEDREPAVGGQDGRVAMEVALAAARSYQEGRPIELSS